MRFVVNEPALLINSTLTIGDLHLGMESELYKGGISVPSQTEKLIKKIEKLIFQTRAKRLILLGDVKHNIPQISWQENKELPRFFEALLKKIRVEVTPGNHDGNLRELVPAGVKIHPRAGFTENGIYFAHGHAWPKPELSDCETYVMAHNHTVVEFRDHLNYRSVLPCWLKCPVNKAKLKEKYKTDKLKLKEVILVPPFNPLIGGIPVNRKESERGLIGPAKHMVDLENSEVYLLDGTHLGKVKKLRN